jgi:hypothetical protein
MDDTPASFLTQWSRLDAEVSTWKAHWQEVCERMDPLQASFYVTQVPQTQQGEKRSYKIFDSTALAALERFSAILESVLTPGGGQPWHNLKPAGLQEELDPADPANRWLQEANRILYQTRYAPKANFASQQSQNYRSLGSVGTNCMYVDSAPGIPLRYRAIPLWEFRITQSSFGVIDQVFRRFSLTARQAVQQFNKRGDQLPPRIQQIAETAPETPFWFIHAVFPNPDVTFGKIGPKGMKWSSRYICETEPMIVRRGGYRTMPYIVSRFMVANGETYGRSPGMFALAEQKMLDEMAKARIRAVHRELDPAWLTMDDAVMTPLRTMPGSVNGGMLDDQGRPRVQPLLPTGVRFEIDAAMTEQTRGVINDFFYITLFQILVDTPNMTATEAVLRAREKAALLAPPTTRQQSECLGPLLERELDLLFWDGKLPPMPEELLAIGGQYEIEYQSPYANAVQADQANAALQTLGAIVPLAQLDPAVLDNYRTDNMARTIGKGFNLPADDFATIEERDAKRAERKQQQMLEMAAGAAKPVAGAVKDLAQAEQIAAG